MEWAHVKAVTDYGFKTWTVVGTSCVNVLGCKIILDESARTVSILNNKDVRMKLSVDGKVDIVHRITEAETSVLILKPDKDIFVSHGRFDVRVRVEDWGTIQFGGETHKLTNMSKRHDMCGVSISASKDALEILQDGFEFIYGELNKRVLKLHPGTSIVDVREIVSDKSFHIAVNRNARGYRTFGETIKRVKATQKNAKRKKGNSKDDDDEDDDEEEAENKKKQKNESVDKTKKVWARVFLDLALCASVTEREEHIKFGRFNAKISRVEKRAQIRFGDEPPLALECDYNRFILDDTQGTANLTIVMDGPDLELKKEAEPVHVVFYTDIKKHDNNTAESRILDLTSQLNIAESKIKQERSEAETAGRRVAEISRTLIETRKQSEVERRSHYERINEIITETTTKMNRVHDDTVKGLLQEITDLRQKLPQDTKDMNVPTLLKYQKELMSNMADVQQKILSNAAGSADLCIVCLEGPKETHFKPCDHAVVCSKCAPKLDKCPKCRCDITERQRLFL